MKNHVQKYFKFHLSKAIDQQQRDILNMFKALVVISAN